MTLLTENNQLHSGRHLNRRRFFIATVLLLLLIALLLFLLSRFSFNLTGSGEGIELSPVNLYFSAQVDGQKWEGPIQFEFRNDNTTEKVTYTRLDSVALLDQGGGKSYPEIRYSVKYISGGPPGAVLQGMFLTGVLNQSVQGNEISLAYERTSYTKGVSPHTYFIFVFTTTNISVNARVNGLPWDGPVTYTIDGPVDTQGISVPKIYHNLPAAGTYRIAYQTGGPPGTVFEYILPPDMNLADGQAGVFTMYFISTGDTGSNIAQTTANLTVTATLDDKPWAGSLNYTIKSVEQITGTSVAASYAVLLGNYTIEFNSGGPPHARLTGITPAGNLEVFRGDNATFTFKFESLSRLNVLATLDGEPWSGRVDYYIVSTNPNRFDAGSNNWGGTVPMGWPDLIPDEYRLVVSGRPPANMSLSAIVPADMQNLSSPGKEATITLQYISTGSIIVQGALDGDNWSGSCSYTINGPVILSGTSLPQTFTRVRPGQYSVSYVSGGPASANLSSISPSASQNVTDSEVTFKLNFIPTGTINVNGFYNNRPWSGPCLYTLKGPVVLQGTNLPQTFSNMPKGGYTISYISGGPKDCDWPSIQPAFNILSTSGEVDNFNLKFYLRENESPVVMPAAADLSVTAVSDDYAPGGAGYVNYLITVSNGGPATATGIKVKFPLAVVSYVSDTPSQGSYNNVTGVWDIGNIGSGSHATLQVYVGMSGAASGTVITNTAEVTAGSPTDPDSPHNNANPLEDDQASVTITIS